MITSNRQLSCFRGSAWEWNSVRGEFYYHAFAVQQPDLNYRSVNVVNQMKDVLRFWLGQGVDGFRVDTIPHLFEIKPDDTNRYKDEPLSGDTDDSLDYGYLDHIYTQCQEETFDMAYQWREVLDAFQAEHGGATRVLLTEQYTTVENIMRFYGDGQGRNGAHIPMNFLLISNLNKDSKARDFQTQIATWMDNMPAGRTPNWVMGNHDQRRVGSRFGANKIDIMNMIDLMLPGASITYMGEEIGMTDVYISWEDTKDPQACNTNSEVFDAHSRDPARTPFQWDATTSAGFSISANTWLPVATDYRTVNVQVEEQAVSSHLKVYRKLIQLRQHDTFKYGRLETFNVANNRALVLIRRIDDDHDIFVITANISGDSQLMELTRIQQITAPNKQTGTVRNIIDTHVSS